MTLELGASFTRQIHRVIQSRPVSQTLGHSLHQVQCEVGSLLHQKLKAVLVNGRELTVRPGHGCGAPGPFIDQRHLSQKIIDADCFNHLVMDEYIHFSFEDYIHLVTRFAFLENYVTSLKRDEELRIPKKMAELHGVYSYAQQDKFQVGFRRESGASVPGREAGGVRVEFLGSGSNYRNRDFRCPGIHAQKARVKAITDRDTQQTCNTLSSWIQPMSLKPTKE